MLAKSKCLGMKKQMRRVKPISPDKVTLKRNIPDIVIEVFNAQIEKNWDERQAFVKQPVVIEEIMKSFRDAGNPIERQTIFDEHWLDIESLFRNAGWKVTYDKPGYNEDFDAYWKFENQEIRR